MLRSEFVLEDARVLVCVDVLEEDDVAKGGVLVQGDVATAGWVLVLIELLSWLRCLS